MTWLRALGILVLTTLWVIGICFAVVLVKAALTAVFK
jgi:hypothetical protein